jgi:hypothetical protein
VGRALLVSGSTALARNLSLLFRRHCSESATLFVKSLHDTTSRIPARGRRYVQRGSIHHRDWVTSGVPPLDRAPVGVLGLPCKTAGARTWLGSPGTEPALPWNRTDQVKKLLTVVPRER